MNQAHSLSTSQEVAGMPGVLLEKVACLEQLEAAFEWVCDVRKDAGPHHSIWALRRHWPQQREALRQRLLEGSFEFGSCRHYLIDGQWLASWDAVDSLVQKALAMVLAPIVQRGISQQCHHLAGRGGTRAAVRTLAEGSEAQEFVLRSDVKSYYDSIDHDILIGQLGEIVPDEAIVRLVRSFLEHVSHYTGNVAIVKRGIVQGSPLSPLLGGVYLKPLDDVIEAAARSGKGVYARYMDDWALLLPNRWNLRRAVTAMNKTLEKLNMKKHPDKTFIGRMKKGFDFLGFQIRRPNKEDVVPQTTGKALVTVALSAIMRHIQKLGRFYEQGADGTRIAQYVKGWRTWARSVVVDDSMARIDMTISRTLLIATSHRVPQGVGRPTGTVRRITARLGCRGYRPCAQTLCLAHWFTKSLLVAAVYALSCYSGATHAQAVHFNDAHCTSIGPVTATPPIHSSYNLTTNTPPNTTVWAGTLSVTATGCTSPSSDQGVAMSSNLIVATFDFGPTLAVLPQISSGFSTPQTLTAVQTGTSCTPSSLTNFYGISEPGLVGAGGCNTSSITLTANAYLLTNGLLPAGSYTQPAATSYDGGSPGWFTLNLDGFPADGSLEHINIYNVPGPNDVTFNVAAAPPAPIVGLNFTPASISASGSSALTMTVTTSTTSGLTSPFQLQVPGGLTITGPVASSCGSTTTAGNIVSLGQGTSLPTGPCTVTVPVTGVSGTYTATVFANTLQTDQGNNANPASATLIVTSSPPTIIQTFSPHVMSAGDTALFVMNLSNADDTVSSTLSKDFKVSLPTNVTVQSFAPIANSCGNLTFDSHSVTVPSGTIIPGGCAVAVIVTSNVPGTYTNTILPGALQTTLGSNASVPDATLNVYPPPTISKQFSPQAIYSTGKSALAITLTNPAGAATLTSDFTDAFPSGMTVVTPLASTCTNSTGGVGATSITMPANNQLLAANLSAPGTCSMVFYVAESNVGAVTNTTGTLQTNFGNSIAPGSATLTVAAPPVITENFNPSSISLGGTSTLTIDIPNPANVAALLTSDFVVNVLSGMTITALDNSASTHCPGVTFTTNSIKMNGTGSGAVSLPAGGCTITVSVMGDTVGNYSNSIATNTLNTALGYNIGGASAPLTVTSSPQSISGHLFADTGVGGGTPNNGVQDGTEAGMPGTGVALTNCASTLYTNTTSAGDGSYTLAVPAGTSGGVCVVVTTADNQMPTGANVGGTPTPSGTATTVGGIAYTYTRAPQQMSFMLPASASVAGLNFGEVPKNTLIASGAKNGVPGATVQYSHIFTAGTGGTVTFSTTASATPATGGWSETLYFDTTCSLPPGQLYTGQMPTMIAGQQICLVMQESIPAGAGNGNLNAATVNAAFTYINASPALNATYTVTDTTTVGSSALTLDKKVCNITTGAPCGASNQATPGQTLEYQVTYTNNSTGPISNLVIEDATPSYTTFVKADAITTPPNLGTCTKNTPANQIPLGAIDCSAGQITGGSGALRWAYSGSLRPGDSGIVRFQVTVQ